MNGRRFHDEAKRVLKPALEHWAWLSAAALLLFAVFVWWTGMTWVPSLLVAVIALAGYIASHQQYREQEARKYRPAIVATFSAPVVEKREGAQGWIPGFIYKFEGSDPALDADFTLQNISESPVTDVRMNFYLHNYERPETPQSFFEPLLNSEWVPIMDRIPPENLKRSGGHGGDQAVRGSLGD